MMHKMHLFRPTYQYMLQHIHVDFKNFHVYWNNQKFSFGDITMGDKVYGLGIRISANNSVVQLTQGKQTTPVITFVDCRGESTKEAALQMNILGTMIVEWVYTEVTLREIIEGPSVFVHKFPYSS